MLRRYTPKLLVVTAADADVPEFLKDPPVKLFGVSFIGQKEVGTNNDNDVVIQVGGEDALVIPPGGQQSWPQPPHEAGYFLSTDFKVRANTDGDGVVILYNDLPGQ